jgi:hypothetical protein
VYMSGSCPICHDYHCAVVLWGMCWGQETVFVIETECVLCEVQAEADNTFEHWAYNSALYNQMPALW